ncbi:D-2-hydroxyacid dehydrogenase, partial [Sinomonas humi]
VYDITQERIDAALARHPELSDQLDITIGKDSDLKEVLEDTEVLFASLMNIEIPREVLFNAPKLKWVNFIGAGVDSISPLDWLAPGVVLTKSSGAHLPVAAEWGLMSVLMLNNSVPRYATNQRQGKWERYFATSVQGKTLGIIGVGPIAGGIAELAKNLGMKVIGVRRTGESHPHVDEMFGPDGIDAVLSRADWVVIGVPSTEATEGLIGRRELELMKPGSGIVSYARGPVIDWDSLREQLGNGHLSGAVVNGLPQEPLPATSALWDTPNLVISQHTGTQDNEQYTINCLDIFFQNMKRYMAGEPMLYQVDPKIGY